MSARHAGDATREVRDGLLRTTIAVSGRLERVQAAQAPDGSILVGAESEAGVEHVRFVLGLEDDHSEFLSRFAGDPLLGEPIRRLRGLRPMRTATVAHALLRAVSGQLIQASRARQIERLVVRACTRGARRPARRAGGRRPRAGSRRPGCATSVSARAAARR